MSGFNFFGNQNNKDSEEKTSPENNLIEFSSSEAEDKKEANPLDMFADSALADANNNDVPLVGEDQEDEEVSYTEGSNHSDDDVSMQDEDYDDVEDGEEFISEDDINNNEDSESAHQSSIVEKAMDVVAQCEDEPITHFDQILSDVSKITKDNKEEELTEKNKFLLNTVMKLSQQASHFKNKVSENILENHQLIDDYTEKLEKKDAALENLQVDIEELEQDIKENEASKNSWKKKYADLRNQKTIEINKLNEDLIRAESSNKQLQAEMDIKVQHSSVDHLKIGKLEEDNIKLKTEIEILGYKINTTEQALNSEVNFKDMHINKLQNQIQSFHQIGIQNNVSVDDYNELIESFKESTNEIDRLNKIIDDREDDLKLLLTKSLTESTADFASSEILKKELMLEKLEKDTLSKQMKEIVEGLENTLKESRDYKGIIDTLESQLLNSNTLLESIENDRKDIFNENIKDKAAIEKLEKILLDRDQLIADLSSQVQYVLLQLTLRTDSDSLSILSKEELNKIKKLANMSRNKSGNKNIQDVISDNLVLFKDINDLQTQNQNLVVSLRELGFKLESLQNIKDHEDLNQELDTTSTNLKQEIKSLENKKLICEQELENLNKLIESNKDYKKQAQNEEIVMNYKVQIGHLEKQLELALGKVLQSSEDSSKTLIENMSKIVELNVQIGDLKTVNKTTDYQLKQALQDKEQLAELLKKEEVLRDELHKHNTDLLISNKDWETALMDAQENLKNAEAENVTLNKSLKSITVDKQSILNDNVKLSNQLSEMTRKMDNIERLRKDMEYLLRHSDEEYWENLALLEKKIKNSDDKEVVNSENNYDSVKHILNAFEKHMTYHNNQATELRKLLQEKNEIIEKLNVETRVNELVGELSTKKKEYEDLQNVLDSYKTEYGEEKSRLEASNMENVQHVGELQAKIGALNEAIKNKDGSIADLNNKITALNKELEESKKSLDSLNVEFKQKVKNLETDYDELEHTCQEYEQRNKTLSAEKDKAVKSLEEEISTLKQQIDTLNEDLSTKEAPKNNEEVDALKQEIDDLKKQIDIKNKIDDVDSVIGDNNEVEETLRKKVEEITAKKTELEEKVKTLEAENREQRASVLKVKLLEQKLKMLSNNAPATEKTAVPEKETSSVPAFSFNIPKEADNSSNNNFAMNSIPQKQAPAFLSHDESKDSATTAFSTSKRVLEKDAEDGEKRVKKDESSDEKETSEEKPEEEPKGPAAFKFAFDKPANEAAKNDFKFGFGNTEGEKKNGFKFAFGNNDGEKKPAFGFSAGNAFNGANSNPFGTMNKPNAFSFGSKTSRFENFAKKDDEKKDDKEDEDKK